MPETANAPIGLAILSLIRQTEEQAATSARDLVARAKSEIEDESLRADLVQLIETVIIYKLSRLSREEIQAMLQVHDIRETRLYQELKEEVVNEERQRNWQEKLRYISKMAALKMSPADIAGILELDVDQVRKAVAGNDRGVG